MRGFKYDKFFAFYESLRLYPTPINLNFAWCFGFMSGLFLVVQLTSGLLLTMHYVADVSLAFDSLRVIMREVPYGWLLRYVHLNGASFFFLAIYLHIAKNIFYGSYLYPRYSLWVSGLVLYLLLVATAFFGYVLPWGQMSYWGATVISGLVSTVPVFGQFLLSVIWGGENITTVTLRRFYTLHFLFPFIILALMFLHLLLLHEAGSNNPQGVRLQDNIILHTFYSLKDFLVIFSFLFFFVYFVFFKPTLLGNPVNALMADVNFTPKKMVPEWYFLPMYTILRSINSRGGGVFLLVNFFLVLFLLPFFTNPLVRSGDLKFFYQIIFFIIISLFIILGWAGSKSLDIFWITVSRVATFLFFLMFLVVLPLVELFNVFIGELRFKDVSSDYKVALRDFDSHLSEYVLEIDVLYENFHTDNLDYDDFEIFDGFRYFNPGEERPETLKGRFKAYISKVFGRLGRIKSYFI